MARFVPVVPVVPVVVWRVVALETPRIRRHCPRCGVPRPFASSDRFRINANGRKLDVWLVYRCTECEGTYNLEVHARVPAGSLAELDRLHHNDPALARSVAFDPRLTRRGGLLDPVPFRVDVEPAEPPFDAVLAFAEPFDVRLDRVLAEGLGVGRSRLKRVAADLGAPAREGLRLRVYAENDIRIVQ